MKYVVISNGEFAGTYEVTEFCAGASSWDMTLVIRKIRNPEEHIAWNISEAAADLVYAHRASNSNIDQARSCLIDALEAFNDLKL